MLNLRQLIRELEQRESQGANDFVIIASGPDSEGHIRADLRCVHRQSGGQVGEEINLDEDII